MDRTERADLLSRLRADAARIADHFGLRYSAIEAEHPRVKSRYGACYETGLIKIRLNHAKTGRPLKYSSMVDTLCHELAHLRHFNHGQAFKDLFLRLLGWARTEGIYRPSSRRRRRLDRHLPDSARPVEPRPERRNGVPVFGAKPADRDLDASRLPWQRQPTTAGQGPTPGASSKPTRPASDVLPLWQQAKPGTPPRRPPTRPTTPRRPGPPRAEGRRQLTLFD